MSLVELLLDPVTQYGFMRYGLAAAAVVGVTSAVLSCLLVVRHQALLGDAISHAVLLGVAVGYVAGRQVGVFWGALAVAVLAGIVITYVERRTPVELDAVMGIVFTFTFALGLAIISIVQPVGIDLFHVLFGNVLGVGPADLALTAASGGLVLAVVLIGFRAFHLWSFDPVMAEAVGLRVGLLQYVFTALLSAAIVASLQAVGLILVVAMLITPGATALLLTARLSTMMAVAAAVGLFSSIGGLYGSYYLDVASGPAIVILATACFVLAFVAAPRRGIAAQALARRKAGRRTLEEDLLKAAFSAEYPGASTPPAALAERIGARPRAVEPALHRLTRRGLVLRDDDAISLTSQGRVEALRMVRTHRLLERYVHEVEGVPLTDLHEVAERMEHEVGPDALADMDRLMGRPRVDPHGHPIPGPGEDLVRIAGHRLSEQPEGATGVVAMVGDDRADLLEGMVRLGILPQREVTVLRRENGTMRVSVEGQGVDVPPEIASRVYVVPG